MLYVFYGSDTKKVADKAMKLVADLLKKKPDAQVFTFEEDVSEMHIDELIEARGLFVEKHIVVLKQPFLKEETKNAVLEKLERFAQTENIFIVVEGKLLAPEKKKLEKHAEKIEEHVRKEEVKEYFNVFQLGDALGERNKRELWSGLMRALRAGNEPESLHGTLHWAVRSMLAAGNSGSPEEAGQKPFVYSKFKRYAKNFKEGELSKLSRELITLYHESRRGKYDLETALERWVLAI